MVHFPYIFEVTRPERRTTILYIDGIKLQPVQYILGLGNIVGRPRTAAALPGCPAPAAPAMGLGGLTADG